MENDSGFHTRGVTASKVTLMASSNVVLHVFVTLSGSIHILCVMLIHIFL